MIPGACWWIHPGAATDANLSLRQLSALTEISNPYLSQVERGLHEPSIRVLNRSPTR